MIIADSLIIDDIGDDVKIKGEVHVEVHEKLMPYAKDVLTNELYSILKAIDRIDPDIILNAQEMLIEKVRKEVEDEQN